jgi:hypothetical protein
VRNNCLNVTVSGRHRARLDPTIEIEEFVSKADIDPRYLIRSHYLFPIRATISPTPPRPSTRPARISSEHVWCSCRSGPKPIFRRARERDWTERKYALWDAGRRLEAPSHGPGKPAHRFRKCPCGEVFDMRPDAVLMHVPHITETTSIRLE